MVENPGAHARVVDGGDEGDARAQAGAEHAQALVAARRQPIQGRAGIHHRLPVGVQRAPHAGRHGVVGPFELRRFPAVVVRHAQPQRREPEDIQQAAQPHVSLLIGVPLGEHQHGAPPGLARREVPGMYKIVFRVTGGEGTAESQPLAIKLVVAHRRVTEEFVAGFDRPAGVSGELGRVVQPQPFQAPLEWANDAVAGALVQAMLPSPDQAAIKSNGLRRGAGCLPHSGANSSRFAPLHATCGSRTVETGRQKAKSGGRKAEDGGSKALG